MAANNSQHRRVFVGNIPYDATEEQLVQICEEVGPVVSFRLVIDRETGKPKGYGFCEYKDEETAKSARRNLQGYEINGRQLRVDFAENDKGADRNREQGRGGPGLASNVDPQKPLGGPAILGDSSLHQPIGLPLAATAASVMAGVLGDGQKSGVPSTQNGLQGQFGLGNDQLTHFMSKMSKNQLYEIMNEMKVLVTQNKELARQLLLSSPQLSKALFQAQIMLGMVSPQVLQMPNIRQPPGSLVQPPLQEGLQDQKPAVFPPHPGQIQLIQNNVQLGLMPGVQEGQLSGGPQNGLVNNQPSAVPFQQLPMQPRFQHSQQTQSQFLAQTAMAGQPGVSTAPSMRPYTGLPIRPQTPALEVSAALMQQVQPPQLQHHRPVGASNLGYNTQSALQNATSDSLLSRAMLSQPNFQHGSSNPMIPPGAAETVTKLAERPAQVTKDARNNRYSNMPSGLSAQKNIRGDTSDPTVHPPKLARMEDGRALRTTMSQNTTISSSVPSQVFGSGPLPAKETPSAEGLHHSEKQGPQSQLAPDVESALLQQVMSLTPEQLSSLPPEQRQQVIQLQQMFR